MSQLADLIDRPEPKREVYNYSCLFASAGDLKEAVLLAWNATDESVIKSILSFTPDCSLALIKSRGCPNNLYVAHIPTLRFMLQ